MEGRGARGVVSGALDGDAEQPIRTMDVHSDAAQCFMHSGYRKMRMILIFICDYPRRAFNSWVRVSMGISPLMRLATLPSASMRTK